MSRPGALLALAAALILAGCGAVPPAPSAAPAGGGADGAAVATQSRFELQMREQAQSRTRGGQLAEAALAWEVLVLLRPDVREYRDQWAETRRRIDAGVADRLQRAAAAQRRGDIEAASQLYLAALALQPEHAAAADALRALERERVRRQQLGRSSRLTLTRRSAAEAQAMVDRPAPAIGVDRNELEHLSMLAQQGELDEAIGLLEARVEADRGDRPARELLGDLYERKADQAQAARDPAAAIGWLEKSLRLDPSDGATVERLRQLKAGAAVRAGDPKAR